MSNLSRREKRNTVALLLAGTVPLGIAGFFSYIEADPGIQLPPRAAPPYPNGFDLYVQAANLSAQPNPPVDPSSDPNPPTSAAQGAIRYSRARREAWHRGAAPAWQLFKQAQQTPTRDAYGYDTDWMPGYARLRQLARDKNAETRLFAMRAEPEKAVNSALDCVQMAFDTSRQGALISRLVAGAICAVGLAPLYETDGKTKVQVPERLTAPQARVATARLEALMQRQPSYVAATETDRWMILAFLDRAFKRGNWRDPDALAPAGGHQRQDFARRMARLLVSKRAVVANINRSYDRSIAGLKAPYHLSAPPPDVNDDVDPISASLMVAGDNLGFSAARENTQLNLMLLRLALQTYRAENGRYPASLDQLQGAILQKIPTDDFNDNKPYRYTLKNGQYRLWSVGPDGVDDGGKALGFPSSPAGIPRTPTSKLPWQNHLPSMLPDAKGDVVARETR